jgi:TRAP-type C4-dicarboxylate transport system permease small subunit
MKFIRTIGNALDAAIAFLIRIGKWIAMASLVIVLILITVNTLGRYAFDTPVKGSEEVVELGMILIVFLALGYASTQGSDVSVTVLLSKFPVRARKTLQTVTYFLSACIVGAIAWRGVTGGLEMFHAHETTGVLLISIYPFRFLLALGAAVLCLKLMADFVKSLGGAKQ